jgi:4-hydroxy-tetrahydrodipicolinate reductase
MPIPVVQLGTGNVGVHALRALITNPDFELTGVWVSSEAKAGTDAGELAGLTDPTGIKASIDLDAVLATGPKCAVYNAMADNRLPEALEDYLACWRPGSMSLAAVPSSCSIRGRYFPRN